MALEPSIVVPLGFFGMVTAIAVGGPYVRALARRTEREAASPKLAPEASARLERMEQAIDAIAVEVERIAEGQRFTTKLLSSRGGAAAHAGGNGASATTAPSARGGLQHG